MSEMTTAKWQQKAACLGQHEIFEAPNKVRRARRDRPACVLPDRWAAARAICATCPVLAQCQSFSLDNLVAGFAGGLTEAERECMNTAAGSLASDGSDVIATLLPVDIAAADFAADRLEASRAERAASTGSNAPRAQAARALFDAGMSAVQVAAALGITDRAARRLRARTATDPELSTPQA